MPGFGYLAALAVTVLLQGPVPPGGVWMVPDTADVAVVASRAGLESPASTSGARSARFDRATSLAALAPAAAVLAVPAGSPAASPMGSTAPPIAAVSPMVSDTPAQPPLIDYSDAYYTRLQIHKWASWAMLPLFAAQYISGQKLVQQGIDAPDWARAIHRPAAVGVAALFGVNTVTGVWNLWEGRKDPYGRKWRTAHGLLMLTADAGFVATGLLANGARDNGARRNAHKRVAMVSMGVAVTSWLMMLPPFRRD